MYQPVVDTNDWTVTDIDDEGFVTLMDDDGNQKEDLQLPTRDFILDPELGEKIKTAFEEDQEVVVKVQSAPEGIKAKERRKQSFQCVMLTVRYKIALADV